MLIAWVCGVSSMFGWLLGWFLCTNVMITRVLSTQATLKTRVVEAQHALTAVELELKQTQELEQEFEAEVAQSYLEAKLTQVCFDVSKLVHLCFLMVNRHRVIAISDACQYRFCPKSPHWSSKCST